MSASRLFLNSLNTIGGVNLNRALKGIGGIGLNAQESFNVLSTIMRRFSSSLTTFDDVYTTIFRNLSGDNFRTILNRLQPDQVRNIVNKIPTTQMDSLFSANMVNNLTADKAGDILHSLFRRADLGTIPNGVLSRLASKLDNAKMGTLLKNLTDTHLTDLLTRHGQLARQLANRVTGLGADQVARLRRLGLRSAGAVGDAAKRGGRICKKNATLCVGAAAVGTYLAVNYAETSEDFKECMTYCLPENWDEYKNDQTTVLQYQTTESIQAAYTRDNNDANFPTDLFQEQPYCTVDHVNQNDDACEFHCRDRCNELHESTLDKIGAAMRGVGKTLETLLSGTLDFLSDPIGFLKTVGIWIVCFIVGIIVLKLILGLIMKLLFNKSRNSQTVTSKPIVVQLSDKKYSGCF